MILRNIRISNILFDKIFEISSSFVNRIENLSNNRRFIQNLVSNYSFTVFIIILIFLIPPFIKQGDDLLINLLIGVILASAISIISIKLGFLTLSGAWAAFIIGVPIFGLGGLKWSIPVIAFFILSSLLTKYSVARNPGIKIFYSKSGKRDHFQVFANGGIAAVLVILNRIFYRESELIYAVFVSSVAAVCADTWATELGTLFKRKTVSILNFRNVAPGTSGGISVVGTFAATAGAFIIALSSLFWAGQNIFNYIVLITAAGLFGSTIDSLTGAAVQRKNICTVCMKVTERTEHCGAETKHYAGLKWISNDLVNLCCSAAGGLFTLILKIA